MDFAENFQKNVTTSKLNLFRISGIFLSCFDCFLPANTTEKKLVELHKFYSAMSLQYSKSQDNRLVTETCVAFETNTRKNGSRDSITDGNAKL